MTRNRSELVEPMRSRWLSATAVSTVLLGLAACAATPTGPEPRKELGIVSFYGDPVVIAVPDTVSAGVPFQVSVRTYGGGCRSEDGTEVDVSGLSVEVRPFDFHSGHSICTDILKMFDHVALVAIEQVGQAQIVFHGAAQPGDSTVVIVRDVVVE